MIRLIFDITDNFDIQVTLILQYTFWFFGYHKDLEKVFDFLSLAGYPKSMTNDQKNENVIMTWILPISLARFLLEKYEDAHDGSCVYMLSHLKTYLNTKE